MPSQPTEATTQVKVDFQPLGRRVKVTVGTTILDAAHTAGVDLVSVCGGHGGCGTCRVRMASGNVSDLTDAERDELTATEQSQNWRLACQAKVLGPVRVATPPASLSTPQRLQTEGLEITVEPDPLVVPVDVVLPPPSLQDLRADATRLADELAVVLSTDVEIDLQSARTLSPRLRGLDWSARAAVRVGTDGLSRLVSLHPRGEPLHGLAVDVGTTKLAAYLVDLGTGQTLSSAAAMNPQISFGEDVMSRIAYANTSPDARSVLQERLIEGVSRLVDELCGRTGTERRQIVDAVVVGNTAMHHLFLGLPVWQLGEAPYVAAMDHPVSVPAALLNLQLAEEAAVYLPPNIAGFVGADHVAMLFGSGVAMAAGTTVAIDIGTNTEISLARDGRFWSCSTASGPAFEGAHIHDGMRAAAGAVERVFFSVDGFAVRTIDQAPAVGICGSGILDAVAAGLEAGLIDERGALAKRHPLVSHTELGPAFTLVPADLTGHGREVIVTRSDINQIQLAKGAIRAGLHILLDDAGVDIAEVDRIIVAGAFGTYLDLGSAITVGLLPDLPLNRHRQVGNAAGRGAEQLLLSRSRRAQANELVRRVNYVDLTTHPDFTGVFVDSLMFEKTSTRREAHADAAPGGQAPCPQTTTRKG